MENVSQIELLAQRPPVQAALRSFYTRQQEIVELIIAIQQIPAPTFAEAERAAYMEQRFAGLGLADVAQDGLHNVYGRFPGHSPTATPLVISAHLDTVFPANTDLTVQRKDSLIYGPGIGDNSAGLAGLLTLAQTLRDFALRPAADIWFVANVGEEGMGDLRGMRAVVERFGPGALYIVLEGGLYGQICHQAIGVRRFRLDVSGPGGHSWGSFGATSAIHVLGRIIAAIADLQAPQTPRTTYNVGLIEGGTSINSIAQKASLWLDLRSEDAGALRQLEANVNKVVQEVVAKFPETAVAMHLVGDRPAGKIPRQTPLVSWAEAALQHVSQETITYMTGSTDTNIPLSQGIPSVCIGLTRTGHAHRLDEYLDTTFLPQGLSQLLLLTLTAAGF
ncbi:MAG: M20/M25/M40 family metallo-hydrolase [Anaerolinea sp.]|nr:M20/M25/M40 family metallo-hydrolase [Anaerolinea sp.]